MQKANLNKALLATPKTLAVAFIDYASVIYHASKVSMLRFKYCRVSKVKPLFSEWLLKVGTPLCLELLTLATESGK